MVSAIAYFCSGEEGYLFGSSNRIDVAPTVSFDISEIPEYTNQPYVVINENKPNFSDEDMKTVAFEKFGI